MKLAIVRQKYTPFGGAERFVERALATLKMQGVDVSVIARHWTGNVKGITCNPFFIGRTWRDSSFAKCVQDIIDSGQFDLVQSHERIPGCHIYRAGDGVHATWLHIRNKFSDQFSPWHRRTLTAEAEMFHHPSLRAVICNSKMVRDDIAQRFGLPQQKLHVIYNGIDLEHFHTGLRKQYRATIRLKEGVGEETKIVLFVGSGFERKGLPSLLEAIRDINSELWVVGRDKAQRAMEKYAYRLGIGKRVRFFGGQSDVRPFYAAADVFSLPTFYDPFPNAALEALACGLPVITTTTCGAAELITSEIGTVIVAGDTVGLSRALSRHLELLTVDTRVVRASVEQLSLDQMARQLQRLYETLCPT